MLNNFFFTLSLIVTLSFSQAIFAADPVSEGTTNTEAIPTQVVPVEALPAETVAAPPEQVVEKKTSTVSNTRPVNDNHTDYRYCLDLKTNTEIIACRYKKK
jgi:hypothetical protein